MIYCYAIDIPIGLCTRAYIRRFPDSKGRSMWVRMSMHSRKVIGAHIARRLLGHSMYKPNYWKPIGLLDDSQEVPQERLARIHIIVHSHHYYHGARPNNKDFCRNNWRFCRCSCGWAADGPTNLVNADVEQHLRFHVN